MRFCFWTVRSVSEWFSSGVVCIRMFQWLMWVTLFQQLTIVLFVSDSFHYWDLLNCFIHFLISITVSDILSSVSDCLSHSFSSISDVLDFQPWCCMCQTISDTLWSMSDWFSDFVICQGFSPCVICVRLFHTVCFNCYAVCVQLFQWLCGLLWIVSATMQCMFNCFSHYLICGQTYTRKVDVDCVNTLASLAATVHKVSNSVCVCVCMGVCVCVNTLCVCFCMCVCTCMCVCVHVYMCTWMFVCFCGCVRAHACVCVHVCICAHECMYIGIYVSIWICMPDCMYAVCKGRWWTLFEGEKKELKDFFFFKQKKHNNHDM